uniref:DUF3627 domain-containing protein n=1 Tax=viral metagenome TaxID=1070528 RepID=A0A6C0EF49_9ZZZZ
MTFTTIEEYNSYLVENQVNVNIIDYVKEVNKLEFKIDISFIDEFIELVSKNECCIHHNMLETYEVLKLDKGTTRVKELLEQNNFKEKKDYQVSNVRELRPQGGSSVKNEYFLHPRAFKICLMRSKNKKEYAYYYILLEECIKYFNDYQIELNKKYIIKLKSKIIKKDAQLIIKDDKIDELIKKTDELLKNNKKILKNNEELIEQNNKTHKMNEDLLKSNKSMEKSLIKANHKLDETLEKLDEVHEELENTHEELEDTNEKLDITDKNLKIVAKKLDIAVEDRVVKTKSKLKNESFIVMYNANEEYKYKVIRGKKEYVDIRINKLEIKNYIQKDELSLNNVPNASTLWCLIKEELKNDIDSCHNKLKLINIDELQFKIKINEIYNKRKNVII